VAETFIVALNGSPNKDGNTAFLLQQALDECIKMGAAVRLLHCWEILKDQKIPFCVACSSPCLGKCSEGSRLSEAFDLISRADGLIVGSPVYFGTVSAQLKAFWDKSRFLRTEKKLLNVVGGAITVGASRFGGQETTLRAIHDMLMAQGMIIVGITKNSPIKMELSYTLRQIDNYLQDQLKPRYPFAQKDPKRQKLCCWFEVPDNVLHASYGGVKDSSVMYAKKDIKGGRGFGVFTIARLDYVEKLQNYDWFVADINIFDAIPSIEIKKKDRDMSKLSMIFKELTRLTQEHYILGYPYPLVEVHNFVSLKKDFKDEIIKRVKFALIKSQGWTI